MASKRPAEEDTAGPSKNQRAAEGYAADFSLPCKSIAMYNYKGGVAKTTITRELAATLSKIGYNVGIIDCDPQCNITTALLGGQHGQHEPEHANVEAEDEEEPVPAHVPQHPPADNIGVPVQPEAYQHGQGQAGLDVVFDQVFGGNYHDFLDGELDRLDEEGQRIGIRDVTFERGFGGERGSIWLLPGSPRVVSYDSRIEAAGHVAHVPAWLGVFRCLIHKMAKEKNLHYVLLDCSPSSGVLNRLAVMSCDYILPPATLDLGSLSSLNGMLKFVIPSWLEYRHATMLPALCPGYPGAKFPCTLPAQFHLEQEDPKILPVITSGFVPYKKKVKQQSSRWLMAMRELVNSNNAQLPLQVRRLMRPERVLNGGQIELVMVWALIKRLDASLSVASEHHWPIAWMTHEGGQASDFSRMQQRIPVHIPAQVFVQVREDAKHVYTRLWAVCRFIDMVRSGQVAAPPGI